MFDRMSPARRSLRRAERYVASGRIAEAVATLEREELRARDLEIERGLRRLRHDVGVDMDRSPSVAPWPPHYTDRFADTAGIVDIARADLTVDTLRSGVFGHGAVIVRGFFDDDATSALRGAVESAFDARDRFDAGDTSAETRAWYDPFEPAAGDDFREIPREWIEQGGGVLAADSPRSLAMMYEQYRAAGIFELIDGYFGDEGALSVLKTTLRIVLPSTNADAGWHQDGAFLGENIRSLNLWLALSHCGRDAASLDIVPRRFDHIVTPGAVGTAFDWTVSNDDVAQLCPDGLWARPEFAPGDVVFFDHMNMHRTGVDPSMTESRYAIESWFFERGSYPHAQIPMSIRY